MKKFKRILLCLLPVVLFIPIFAQSTSQDNAEIVILMDTSGTILPYYEDINNRVLTEINNKFVRKGDSIHILSFNADARYEMSQKINNEADMSRVVSRFLLLYQLGKNSDFLTGLQYAKQYISNLPEKKDRILIIVSDGIFNPPMTSPYKSYTEDQIKNEMGLIAGNIRKKGWKVYYVKLPYPADAIIRNLDGEEFYSGNSAGIKGDSSKDIRLSSDIGGDVTGIDTNDSTGHKSAVAGSVSDNQQLGDVSGNQSNMVNGNPITDVSKEFQNASGAATSELSKDQNDEFKIIENAQILPAVRFPDEGLEAHNNKINFPLEITNSSNKDIELHLTHIVIDNGISISTIPVYSQNTKIKSGESNVINVSAELPSEYSSGNYNVIMRLEFADGKRVLPQVTETSLAVFPTTFERIKNSNYLWLIILMIILLLLIILLIIFFVRRRSSSSYQNNVRYPYSGNQVNYQGEEKRYPHQLSDEDDHANRLNAFNSSSSAIYTDRQEFAGDGNSIYSSSNLDKIETQKRDDEALRKRVLAASFATKQPRGAYMSPANYFEAIEIKCNQSGMTEIYVLNQNRNIGKRNIHVMKPGTRLTLGGGKMDDFLIFLVPFPANLAQVRYDGKDYHLAILKPKYFPYETSNIVNNCIGKIVTIVSDKGYHVYFTFREYENQTDKLNNILTSIKYE